MTNYSVVMCVYHKDKPKYFKEAIDSILNQSKKTNDLVIVCDGPLDKELKEIIKDYKKRYSKIIKVIELDKNLGLGKAMNIGVSNCKNEIIGRVDSDDISTKDRFEKELKCILDNDLDIVGSYIEEIEKDGKRTSYIRKVPETNEEIVKYLKYRSPFNHPTIMFKRMVLEENKYEDLLLFEDYYLFSKLAKSNYKLGNIKEVLVYMRSDNDMYRRRGGLLYIKRYLLFLNRLLKEKYINIGEYIISLIIRIPIMLLPTFIRKKIYRLFLRKKTKKKTDK